MIVSESDLLTAALDRRLQVDRLLGVGPLAPNSGANGGSRPAAPQGSPSAVATAAPDSIAARLPLGQTVAARVIEVPSPNLVVAEIADLLVTLSWPGLDAPQPGVLVALRVLAHSPLLLFESAPAGPDVTDQTDTPTHFSAGALQLQPSGAGGNAPVRFRTPILEIEIRQLATDGEHRADPDGANTPDTLGRIALDEVIVAQSARIADERVAPSSTADAARESAVVAAPLVLQGPAWRGQDVELVFRRERADRSFDNPALDQWYGDLVIDLPNLGRVAGHLAWSMQGLRIRLEGQDEASVSSMNAATAELATAMTSEDLYVLSVSVGQPVADAATPRRG